MVDLLHLSERLIRAVQCSAMRLNLNGLLLHRAAATDLIKSVCRRRRCVDGGCSLDADDDDDDDGFCTKTHRWECAFDCGSLALIDDFNSA